MNITSVIRNDYWEDYYIENDNGDNRYLVTIDVKEKTVFCTCPNFKFRKAPRAALKFGGVSLTDRDNHCKHISYALQVREVLRDG